MAEATTFEGWVILELMGHRRLAGHLREQEIAGQGFLRLDVYTGTPTVAGAEPDEPVTTQFYAPQAVYCITPTTEETARRVADPETAAPVKRWELPARPTASQDEDEDPNLDPDEWPAELVR